MSDCIIQISRDNSFYGSGLTVGVALDGCDVGTLKNGGDQVVLDGVAVTLLSVTENSGQNYVSPDDGKVFVLCEFEIENNSSRDIASSTMLSFESYIDGYTTSLSLTAMMSSDEPQLDGTIAAGKKMKGVVGYEAPQDWSEIEIRFSPSFWGSEIIFEYEKLVFPAAAP